MNDGSEPVNAQQLLGRLRDAHSSNGRVSLGAMLDTVGHRSFGPLILVAGLITLAPVIGDIPGVPTIIGIFVLLTAGQLLCGRRHFWLPCWLLNRSVQHEKFCKLLGWLHRPASFFDRLLRPRFTLLTHGPGLYLIAAVCIAIAAAMPVMEVVPFSANGAGAALTAFGLALMARDGVVALVALLITAGTIAAVVYSLL